MQKNLVIVESPAKAKTIEKFLGSDYKVMSSYGHIRDLKKKEKPPVLLKNNAFAVPLEGITASYSLPGKKGLPKRVNFVLTSNADFEAERCTVVHSEDELWEALSKYEPDEVFLIGGATLYNRFYKYCDKLYVTKIDADLGADTFIVDFDKDPDFEIISESEPVTENGLTYRFVIYKKKDD